MKTYNAQKADTDNDDDDDDEDESSDAMTSMWLMKMVASRSVWCDIVSAVDMCPTLPAFSARAVFDTT